MKNFLYIDAKGGVVLLNTKHILYFKARIDNNTSYINIHLSNGNVIETMDVWKNFTDVTLQQYIKYLSEKN